MIPGDSSYVNLKGSTMGTHTAWISGEKVRNIPLPETGHRQLLLAKHINFFSQIINYSVFQGLFPRSVAIKDIY